MSRNITHNRTRDALSSAWRRARRAAARLHPAADQIIPLAKNAGAVAKHQADRTRAWAAPQVERAGKAVEDSVAPRASSMLSAAARRLEPDKPPRKRWRTVAGLSAATAAASAFAVAVRSRVRASATAPSDDRTETGGGTSAAQTSATESAPKMEIHNGHLSPGSDLGQDSAARTS